MSKLIDMLEKTGDFTPGPMGFGLATSREKSTAQMVLVVRASTDLLTKTNSLEKVEADAILVDTNIEEFREVTKSLSNRPCGFYSAELTALNASELVDSCCDFVIFESLNSEAAITNIVDLGIVAVISADMDKETVRSIGMLPIDAVLLRPSLRDQPLTVNEATDIQKLARLVGKPVLVETPNGISQQNLEVLKNIGVEGLIVDVENTTDLDKITKTNEAISKLQRAEHKTARRDAIIPQIAATDQVDPDDTGDDEDF